MTASDFKQAQIIELAGRLAGDTETDFVSLHDVSLVEVLGQRLAELLRSYKPDIVLTWSDVSVAVLGHVVARELGADVVHAYSVEGILSLTGPELHNRSVVLLDHYWTRLHGLAALARLAIHHQATVTAIASVLPVTSRSELSDVPVIELAAVTGSAVRS